MKLRYELDMPIEAAEERLNQHMNLEHSLLSVLAKSLLIPFYSKVGMFGKLKEDKFWLVYICGGHRYAIRCFFAEFINLNGTTILQGEFRFSIITWLSLILPCCGLLLIGSAVFQYEMFWIPCSLILLSLFVVPTILMGIQESKPRERKIEEFLLEIYSNELMPKSTNEPDDHQQMSEQ